MCKDEERGLGTGLLCMYKNSIFYSLGWKDVLSADATWVGDSAAWKIEYMPSLGYYRFKNVKYERYLTNQSSKYTTATSMSTGTSPNTNPSDYYFQLMPDRRDVTYGTEKGDITTHGYWFTWTPTAGLHKAMSANEIASGKEYGTFAITDFDYADTATKQMFIIISEDELQQWKEINGQPTPVTLKGDVNGDGIVNGTDIQAVINFIVAGEYDEKADVNQDELVNGTDIQEIINIIVRSE
jgi:hypothetical protein